jgi:phosphohistidine phosphatase
VTTGERTLILVRHAKSSWAESALSDHDRPLNARGIRDAPRMAERLAQRGPRPDRLVTSSAARALATARAFASALGLSGDELVVRPDIYGASVPEMLELIRGLDDRLRCVAVVGHNPTFTELAEVLAGPEVGALPTCAVLTLGLDERRWADLTTSPLRVVSFDFPKKDAG